jgi:hypothetical protein
VQSAAREKVMATPRRRTSVVGGGAAPPQMGMPPAMGARRQSAVGGRRASAVAPGMAGGMAAMMAGQSDLQTFNLFDRLLNESLRQSYFLGPDSYFMFWSCLTDEKLAIQFVTQLITSVVEIDELIETKKKPSKDKKSKDEHPQAIGVPLEEVGDELFGGPTDYRTSMKAARAALMSTIMFIATHFDIKASSASTDDKPMFEAIEAWKKRCTQAKATGRNEKASHTYAQFTASFVEDKASFSNEVDLMEALDAAVNVQNAKGLVCPFQMPTDIVNQNMGPAFSWHFIMKLCGEGEQKRQEVFAALMDMLRVHNTEPRLLCLLHIFTALLHSFSPWNTDQLRRLVPTLELFYFWPCPFGPLAQALAGLVERELSCPGAAMRDRFMAEVPHVDETCESGEEEEATYRVPVILEAGTANSGFLKWVAHDEIVKCGRPNSRTAMIWFLCDMIRCTCPEPLAEEAVWALSDVALEEITPLYQEACRIDLEAQAAAEQDAAAVLVRMSEIKSQLETQHGTNSPSMSAGDMMTPRARMRGQGGGMRGKGGARRESVRRTSVTTGMAARGMRRASSAPGLPADLFSSMDQAGGAEQVTIGADEMQLRLHFEPFELDCSHSSDYSYPAAMAASVGVTLRQIISSEQHVTGARSGATAASRTLKICIAGGSRTLHAYVCALVELKQSTNPADAALIEMLSSCPVSLYLLPIGSDSTDNVMGEFIARADGWYAKHILTGLASPVSFALSLSNSMCRKR